MPLFESRGNISIKKITSIESESHFQPTFSLAELTPAEKKAMDAQVQESFAALDSDLSSNASLLLSAAIVGYRRPARSSWLSRELFSERNVESWRERLSHDSEQLPYYLAMEAMVCAYAPELRRPLVENVKKHIRAGVLSARQDGSRGDWNTVLWECAYVKIIESTEEFLTAEDWVHIGTYIKESAHLLKNSWNMMKTFERIRILNPDFPIPLTRERWDDIVSIIKYPDNASILGSQTIQNTAARMILASGGIESTASGVRLLPPHVPKKETSQPPPIRKHI